MIIANLIILPLGLLSAKACIRLLSIKSQYIQMAVLLICCVGAYSMNQKLYRCDRYVHCRNLWILLP